jgi:hypothetical protein
MKNRSLCTVWGAGGQLAEMPGGRREGETGGVMQADSLWMEFHG